jgi:hypothetical protein
MVIAIILVMKKLIITLLLIPFLPENSLAQDSLIISKTIGSGSSYIDCYEYKEGLVALSKYGDLYFINYLKETVNKMPANKFAKIAVDRKGDLWAADSFSMLYTLKDTGWKTEKYIAAKNIWQILFSNSNNIVLITDLGIYDSKNEMYYGVNKFRNSYSSMFPRTNYKPSHTYIDSKNNLWVQTASRRIPEIHIYSIKKRRFVTNELKGSKYYFHSLRTIFGNKRTIFFAELELIAGMSAIYRYKKDTIRRIHHPEYDTMNYGPLKKDEEYIGAALYSKKDNSIYYYSDKGLFKAKYNKAKQQLKVPIRILPPYYLWNGYNMDASSFTTGLRNFFKNEHSIFFLGFDEGIFIYNEKGVINYR